jgi:hypothetical protein
MKMNSITSWVGGKKSLRDLIYQRMPKEFGREYLEKEDFVNEYLREELELSQRYLTEPFSPLSRTFP